MAGDPAPHRTEPHSRPLRLDGLPASLTLTSSPDMREGRPGLFCYPCTPAASLTLVDRRTQRRLLHRDRRRWAKACLCLFRGGARPAIGGQAAHEGRGAKDRG